MRGRGASSVYSMGGVWISFCFFCGQSACTILIGAVLVMTVVTTGIGRRVTVLACMPCQTLLLGVFSCKHFSCCKVSSCVPRFQGVGFQSSCEHSIVECARPWKIHSHRIQDPAVHSRHHILPDPFDMNGYVTVYLT